MTTRREKLLQKLNPQLLKMTPRLSGDTGSFIDLNTKDSSLEDGAKKLMMRFMRNQELCERFKRKTEKNDVEVTISSAKYNENEEICELVSEKLTIPLLIDDDELVSEKPGRKLQKLKMELQDKMSAKWEEEYRKRVSENKMYNGELKDKKKGKKLSDDEANSDSDEEKSLSEADEEKSISGADEEEEVTKELDEEENCDFDADVEDEVGDASSDDENEGNEVPKSNFNKDDEYDESGGCSLVPAYQPGGGLLYGGSELTQQEEDLPKNLLSPSLKLSVQESPNSKSFNESSNNKEETAIEEMDYSFVGKNKLFSNSQNANDSFDLNDVFDLCSGKFPDAEGSKVQSETQSSAREDSDPCDGFDKKSERDEESQSQKDLPKTRKNILTFEDSETEENVELDEAEETDAPAAQILSEDEDEQTVKIKKKTKKILHFSDEEDETNDKPSMTEESPESDEDEDDEDVEDVEDCDQRSVHYDSEENEIINPKEFFEREAELSGSEWSGDEDERGLDEFDREDGDADNIDDDQVRSQLEKIHIRRVLDDDAREVRLIQELLFEDGDLHSDGKKRDRKFKWKNLGTFEEKENEGESKEDGGNSSEEDGDEEEKFRKIRHERELFLMEKKKNGDESSDDEILEEKFQTVKVTTLKKFSATDNNKTILDYTEVKKSLSLSNARGSFLTRNEEFLSRLAKATSAVSDNILGPKNSKNFVFATKSPEKTEDPERSTVCKRQVEESEKLNRREKRIKLAPPIHTGPSILDLLT